MRFQYLTDNDEALLLAYLKASQSEKALSFLQELEKLFDSKSTHQRYLWYRINLIFSTETKRNNAVYWLNKSLDAERKLEHEKKVNSNKTSQLISVYLLNETKEIIRNEQRSKAYEIKMLRSEKANNTTIIILLLSGLGLLVMIVIASNQIWKNRRKAYLLKNEKLELENSLKELKIKTQENHIIEYALDFTKNTQYEQNMVAKLQQLAKNDEKSLLPELRSLVAELRQKSLIDKRAEELVRTSDDVLGQFYDTLLKMHPDLSKSEVKLCSLVRLELSNKEIALIKNVTPESIKIFKNRLKRKLNITSAHSLKEYLKTIATEDSTISH
ncbi:hypothetical protein D3C86_1332430 [compost metagenome]